MRTRIVIGSLVASMMTFQVLAQRAENDDMYFTAKDREKLRAENASMSVNTRIDNDYKAFKKKHFDKDEEETVIIDADTVNPTDSYSARHVNPEYISRSNSEQASEDESYYVEGYTPPSNYGNSQSYDNYSSNGYNNWNNNNNWNNPYNSWNNPYNNCFSCSNMWNPYYGGSGLSLSFGYGWGNMYNPWNYGMGYGSYNPYGGYYSPYAYGYGYPYYGGYEVRRVNYGKRPSRHSAVVTPTPRTNPRGNVVSNGRTSDRSRQTSDESYVRPTRRTATSNGTVDRTTERSRSNNFDYNRSRTRESSSPRESRSSSYTPSRSSSSPSRSSGSSSGSRRGGRD